MADADRVLRAIADRQKNLVTRDQALTRDVTDRELRHRLAKGLLRPVFRAVYFVGGGEPSFEQRAFAAALACGDDAFVSGRSAAVLWGLVDDDGGPIHVTVPASSSAGIEGVALRRTRKLGPSERTTRDGVPIARVNRALLDLAGQVAFDVLEDAADEAIRRRLTTPAGLLQYLEGCREKGVASLRRIARDRDAYGTHDTDFEKDAERVLLAHGLPRPHRQVWFTANGRKVRFDLAYPEERVVVEPNGEGPHWGRRRWQSDHDKRIAAKQADVNMLEFTWDDVHHRQLYFVTTVGDALGLRPVRWVKKFATKSRTGVRKARDAN